MCLCYGTSQARILEWVIISFSRESSQKEVEHESPALTGGFFYHQATRETQIIRYYQTKQHIIGVLEGESMEKGAESLFK